MVGRIFLAFCLKTFNLNKMKKFDLNIEKILENWEAFHAVREIIANALDEQLLTNSQDVIIQKKGQRYIIRDFGRGLKYTHLTQNENDEKLNTEGVIGKFGIGLKDALATFDRQGVKVRAKSRYNIISIDKSTKQDFQDIVTLHAIIEEPSDPNFIGTEFELEGVTNSDINQAKRLFLKFSGHIVIENTKYGQIISGGRSGGDIFINGVKVAEEENFLFSYNITQLNSAIKKALNRERSNVGRTAYSDSIKRILLSSESKQVAENLADDLCRISEGTAHDELAWIDVQEHAVKILNQKGRYLFITSYEAMMHPDMIDQAKGSGYLIITIPENLRSKIRGLKDIVGGPIVDIGKFVSLYNESFEFDFVKPRDLSPSERKIFDLKQMIIDLVGGLPPSVKDVRISNSIRKDFLEEDHSMGCWDSKTGSIVLDRGALVNIKIFSGVLIHEIVHSGTGFSDVSRDFENSLTEVIGELCERILSGSQTITPIIIRKSDKTWFEKLFGI